MSPVCSFPASGFLTTQTLVQNRGGAVLYLFQPESGAIRGRRSAVSSSVGRRGGGVLHLLLEGRGAENVRFIVV